MGGAFCSYWFCYFRSKHWFATIDDTVDAFGAHGISGVWGGIATGLFAEDKINPAVGNAMKHDGAFFG
jgi:Amt family ammonium transporter